MFHRIPPLKNHILDASASHQRENREGLSSGTTGSPISGVGLIENGTGTQCEADGNHQKAT
jgi:hypothetical protein